MKHVHVFLLFRKSISYIQSDKKWINFLFFFSKFSVSKNFNNYDCDISNWSENDIHLNWERKSMTLKLAE